MGNDLRAALSKAMESGKVSTPSSAEAAPAAPPPAPVSEGATVQAPTTDSPSRDASGRFQGKGAPASAGVAVDDTPGAPQGEAAGAVPSPAPAAKPTSPKHRPPQAWGVKVREKWETLDPEVQEEIARRERDIANRVREDGEYRRFRESLNPYAGILGSDPTKGALEVIQREAAFRNAPPAVKAQMIADMVQQGQVPVDALDQYLSQRLQGQPSAQPAAPQEFKDPRFDAFLAQMEQMQKAKTRASVEEFRSSHEFFDDVQGMMAGLIEGGVAKDLASAYDKAILLHPEVRSVMEQRKAAEAAKQASASAASAKAAAMSVRSSPITATAPAPTSLRDQLAANVAAARRR